MRGKRRLDQNVVEDPFDRLGIGLREFLGRGLEAILEGVLVGLGRIERTRSRSSARLINSKYVVNARETIRC